MHPINAFAHPKQIFRTGHGFPARLDVYIMQRYKVFLQSRHYNNQRLTEDSIFTPQYLGFVSVETTEKPLRVIYLTKNGLSQLHRIYCPVQNLEETQNLKKQAYFVGQILINF